MRIRGLSLHVEIVPDNSSFTIYLKQNNRKVGSLDAITEPSGRTYVGFVVLNKKLRNQGWGKRLYEIAINYNGELHSRLAEASTEAQRVWFSLIRSGKYNYDLQDGSFICIWPKGKRKKTGVMR